MEEGTRKSREPHFIMRRPVDNILDLSIEIQGRILGKVLNGARDVDVISRVCRRWKQVVFVIPWNFHAYWSPHLVTVHRDLPSIEGFFLINGTLYNDAKKEARAILEWVRRNKVRSLRIHIVGNFLVSSQARKLFRTFLDAGVEDLLVRERANGALFRYPDPFRGFWYQKAWNLSDYPGRYEEDCGHGAGSYHGRLVFVHSTPEDLETLLHDLQPLYLVLNVPYMGETLEDIGHSWSVKILGFGRERIPFQAMNAFDPEEIRILDSDPLDPFCSGSERYGVLKEVNLEDLEELDIPVCEGPTQCFRSVQRVRGGVKCRDAELVLSLFPNVQNLPVLYNCRTRIEKLHDSVNSRTCIYHVSPTFFHVISCILASSSRKTLVQSLSLRDIVTLTHVLPIRSLLGPIRISSAPISALRLEGLILEGIMRVTRVADLDVLKMYSIPTVTCNLDLQLSDEALLAPLISLLDNGFFNRFRILYHFEVTVQTDPQARIFYDRTHKTLHFHLPSSHAPFHNKLTQQRAICQDNIPRIYEFY